MRHATWVAAALMLLAPAQCETADAALAPKFERSRQLSAALTHLNEIAHMLDEPIDTIEYAGNEVSSSPENASCLSVFKPKCSLNRNCREAFFLITSAMSVP